jgi:Hsp70 protein
MAETASQRQRDFRVAAAIDFGTHSTGFAWAPVSKGNEDPASRKIELYYRWPDQPVRAAKTLSAVLLTAGGAVEAWGYAARRMLSTGLAGPSSSYYYSFKRAMAGRGEQDAGTFSRTPLSAHLPEDPAEARDIAVAYLREIVRVAAARIEEAGYQPDDIRWCVTVPAIWDDASMSLTRGAAVLAGLPADAQRLRLVREPEAAALSCLADGAFHVDARQDPAVAELSRGTRYQIVDCGGGTVDISAYEVDDSGGLRQIGETLGGWLGSEYLNDAFINSILARRIGGVAMVSDLIRSDPEVLLDLADEWERQKLTVDAAIGPDGSVTITGQVAVRLSASAHAAILRVAPDLGNQLRNHIIVEPAELAEVFDGVVDPILAVVDRELAAVAGKRPHGAPPDKVLLVGGFADCRYLQLRLKQHLKDRATVDIPAYGAEAILRGAVHYCYNSTTISARLSRHTYGFAVALPFENGLDPEASKITSDYNAEILCNDRFCRVVEIGQSVPVNHEYRTQVRPVHHDQTELVISLYTSTDRDPRYASESVARGTFTVDISATSGWHVPLGKRTVDLAFRFGGADITVTATETETGRSVTQVIAFERTDEDAPAEDRRAARPGFGRLLPSRRTRAADEHAADPNTITKKYAELTDQRLLFVARELAGREVARTKGSDLGRSTAYYGRKLSWMLFGEAPPDRQQVFGSLSHVTPATSLARDLAKLVDDARRLRATSARVTWDFTVDKGAGIRPDQTPWGSCDREDPVQFVVTPALLIDGELCRGQVVYTSPDSGAALTGPQPALSRSSAGTRSGRRSPR